MGVIYWKNKSMNFISFSYVLCLSYKLEIPDLTVPSPRKKSNFPSPKKILLDDKQEVSVKHPSSVAFIITLLEGNMVC